MKRILSILIFIPLFSYSQVNHVPLGLTGRDTIDISNSQTAGRDYYSTIPRPLQPSDKVYKNYVDSLNYGADSAGLSRTLKSTGFSYIGFDQVDTAIVKKDISSWDGEIRELGNVFKYGDSIYICYSGYNLPYTDNNVYVGLAASIDGITWFKLGKMVSATSEDPYIIYFNSQFFLYVEDKISNPSPGIHGYTSPDLYNWTDQGVVVAKDPALPTWQSRDVSSPTPKIVNDSIYLFFEGRGTLTDGAIGLTKSANGLSFTPYSSTPIIAGSEITAFSTIPWSLGAVCDDLFEIDSTHYITVHAFNHVQTEAVLKSRDLIHWQDAIGTYMTTVGKNVDLGDGVMIYNYKPFFILGGSIYMGQFSQNPYGRFTEFTQPTATAIFRTTWTGRDEIINVNITANRIFELTPQTGGVYSDTTIGSGVIKIIKNPTLFNLTIRPLSGVTIDGSTSDIILTSNRSITLTSTSFNKYITTSMSYLNDSSIGTTNNRNFTVVTNGNIRSTYTSTGKVLIGTTTDNGLGDTVQVMGRVNAGNMTIGRNGIIKRVGTTLKTITNPAEFTNAGATTGMLVIKHPTLSSATMFDFRVKLYNTTGYVADYRFAVYKNTATTISASSKGGYVISSGTLASGLVRAAFDASGNFSVILGDTATTWTGQLRVIAEEIIVSNSGGGQTTWDTGWSITNETTLANYTSLTDIGVNPFYGGGTGQTVYAVGDILAANTTTTLSKIADVATGNSLISGGVGVLPSWGKIGLTTHVSGILPIANGGTGISTTPANGTILIGNGTNYTNASLGLGYGILSTTGAGTLSIRADTASSNGLVTQNDLTVALNTNTAPYTASSAATLNITTAKRAYIYNGVGATTWTLPTVASSDGYLFFIINKSVAGVITINSNAGANDIWIGTTTNTTVIGPGETARIFQGDGTFNFSN